MKTRIGITLALLIFAAAALAHPPNTAQAAFEKMKTLVGEWTGTGPDGTPAQISYRVVSDGSAIEETITEHDNAAMVTIYHLDGNRLLMTHYCGAGNQPRMRASGLSPDGNQIVFAFRDVTNRFESQMGYMHGLEITFVDDNHMNQQWTWLEKGKTEQKHTFKLTRKRS